MMLPFEIVIWVVMIVSLAYLVVISILTYGWFSLKEGFIPKKESTTEVSIVVAVRNEEKNIDALLERLFDQEYPKELMEVIFVDDHSEDDTAGKIDRFFKQHSGFNIRLLSAPGTGKKDAISFGIENSNSRFILTTDGDCIPGRRWVRMMTAYHEVYQPKIVLGPVVYSGEKNILQKLFSLDFVSMVASGAGGAGAGLPFMGNAANMAFDKAIFSGDELQSTYSSGDDVFLIHTVKKAYGGKFIQFIKEPHALVTTNAPVNWQVFFNQRLRWASKAKGYRDSWSRVVSWVVLLFNLSMVSLFIVGLWWSWLLAVWVLFITLKAMIDFPILNSYAQLTGKGKLLIYLWPMEFLYPFYITLVGLGSLFIKYSWKGRAGLK